MLGRISLQRGSVQSLEWAAWCSGGVPIPGGIQDMCGHGTKDHGFVMSLSIRLMVGFGDHEGLFYPKWFGDPVILCPTFPAQNQPDSYYIGNVSD